jgi:hypothetical protein
MPFHGGLLFGRFSEELLGASIVDRSLLADAAIALHFHWRSYRRTPSPNPISVQTNAKTVVLALVAVTSSVSQLRAQKLDPSLYSSLEWRMIGPFRGGRTIGATGVRGQPNVFYVGVNNGGVWKTTDAGRVWTPIFDDQPTGSVGDVAVAPSNPNVIYVGSGEGVQRPDLSTGDGIYRSSIHATKTESSPECWDIRMDRTPSAGFTDRRTVARLSSAFSTKTRIPARPR